MLRVTVFIKVKISSPAYSGGNMRKLYFSALIIGSTMALNLSMICLMFVLLLLRETIKVPEG